MAQQVCVVLSSAEREQLAAIAADRNRPRKHVERAQRPHSLPPAGVFLLYQKGKDSRIFSGLRPRDRRFAHKGRPETSRGFLIPIMASQWRDRGTQEAVSQSSYLHES